VLHNGSATFSVFACHISQRWWSTRAAQDSLVHAYGAAFDNPDLIVSCIIGDGHDAFRHGRAEQSRPLSTRAGRHVRMFGSVRSSSRDILKKYSSKFQRLNELL
jgi:XFP N-terminal domain